MTATILRLRVSISGPLERVRAAAHEASRNFKPFGPKNVTPALLKPVIDMTVVSDVKYDQGARGVLHPENVVVLPPTPKGVEPIGIQPVSVTKDLRFSVVTGMLGSYRDEAPGLTATFRIAQLPPEFEVAVVVAGDSLRRSCRFNAKNVKKVLGISSEQN